MVRTTSAALSSAFVAIELFPFLLEQVQSNPAATTFGGAVQVFLPLAAILALFAAVAVIHLHLHHAAAGALVGAGRNKKRVPELVPFVLCMVVGILEFFLFVLPAGAGVNGGGAALVDALPASAAVVFFLGITLVIAHIRAGGEGGGGGAVEVPVPVVLLKKIVLGATAALLGQITVAVLYVM
ncbi:hypothetical protein QOZ80_6BG0464540 [Eleusine coracana subsp. coracana]|nr:hypothetical protein QOZ80_6BG0464540 [Eleusine coracana subsp. coracana]